jgi:hypothetical protein
MPSLIADLLQGRSISEKELYRLLARNGHRNRHRDGGFGDAFRAKTRLELMQYAFVIDDLNETVRVDNLEFLQSLADLFLNGDIHLFRDDWIERLFFAEHEPFNLATVKALSLKAGNRPVLVRQGDKYAVYGSADGENWRLKLIDSDLMMSCGMIIDADYSQGRAFRLSDFEEYMAAAFAQRSLHCFNEERRIVHIKNNVNKSAICLALIYRNTPSVETQISTLEKLRKHILLGKLNNEVLPDGSKLADFLETKIKTLTNEELDVLQIKLDAISLRVAELKEERLSFASRIPQQPDKAKNATSGISAIPPIRIDNEGVAPPADEIKKLAPLASATSSSLSFSTNQSTDPKPGVERDDDKESAVQASRVTPPSNPKERVWQMLDKMNSDQLPQSRALRRDNQQDFFVQQIQQFSLEELVFLTKYMHSVQQSPDDQKHFDAIRHKAGYCCGGTHLTKSVTWQRMREAVKERIVVKLHEQNPDQRITQLNETDYQHYHQLIMQWTGRSTIFFRSPAEARFMKEFRVQAARPEVNGYQPLPG